MSPRPTRSSSRPVGLRWVALWVVALLATSGAVVAAPPEIVRVRVPADRLPSWFPPGTELTGLSAERFEALAAEARQGASRLDAKRSATLLRARHFARWDAGMLVGRSEFTIAPGPAGQAEVPLAPWSPAVVPTSQGGPPVRADDAGRLWLDASSANAAAAAAGGPSPIVVAWNLRARPGSRDRRFSLALPAAEISEFSLDLPDGLEPEGPVGLRQGPRPGDTPGRSSWTFLGATEMTELKLVRPDGQEEGPESPRLWCTSATRVELGPAGAAWTLEWSVQGGPAAPRVLVFDLDPGLELLSVSGPAVDEYQAAPAGDAPAAAGADAPSSRPTRVKVRLQGDATRVASSPGETATTVVVKALAAVPSEGRWVVPSAHPVNATWTGGTTTVTVGPDRVVRGVRPIAGRRGSNRKGERDGTLLWFFAAERPEPVAEFDLAKPPADASVAVRGWLTVGPGVPRLDARLTWQVDRGRLLNLDFRLPRGWSAERVEVEGVNEPVSWIPSDQGAAGTHVRVALPAGDWSSRPLVLRVSAASAVMAGGRLSLPRVRPVDDRVSDEVWIARGLTGVTVRPGQARGLAWLNPATVEPSASANDAADLPALAWRWVRPDAEAELELDREGSAPVLASEMLATITPGRLRLEARLALLGTGVPPRTLGVGLSGPVPDPAAWRFFDERTGLQLTAKREDPRALPGPAWVVDLPPLANGPPVVIARYEGRLEREGPLPLFHPTTASWPTRGVVLVEAARNLKTTVATRDVVVLDPDVVSDTLELLDHGDLGGESSREPEGPALRRAHAFAFENADATATLKVEQLSAEGQDGVIRDAVLTTWVSPGDASRHRLTLRVAFDRTSTLSFTLPPGATLERVRRDGQPLDPVVRSGPEISVPLTSATTAGAALGAGTARGPVTVTLDYRGEPTPPGSEIRVRPERPILSLPCLALTWEIVAPEPWSVEGWGVALTPSDPASRNMPSLLGRLTSGPRARDWTRLRRRFEDDSARGSTLMRELDARVSEGRGEEQALGDWLLRWDAGPWPIVIDRQTLASAGWGPRSRVSPPRLVAGSTGAARASLEPIGLTVVPLDRSILVTTKDEAQALATERSGASTGPDAWSEAVTEAAAWGADRAGRFETVARWREQSTPRPTFAIDALPPAPRSEGRVVRRFTAVGWPNLGVEVTLRDARTQSSWAWITGLAVLTAGLASLRLSRMLLGVGVSILLAVGLLTIAFAPSRWEGPGQGCLAGAVGVACLAFGRSISVSRRRPRSFEPRTGSTAGRRRGARLVAPPVVGLICLGAVSAAPWAFAQLAAGPPILAFFPFEGTPGLNAPVGRVVLRLSDYQKLKALAEATEKPGPVGPRARDVVHRVLWRDPGRGEVEVASALTLEVPSGAPTPWSFPIEGARNIRATVDGVDVPVRIEDAGGRASALVSPRNPGEVRRLVLTREFVARPADGGHAVVLGVNPIATARVEVAPHPAGLGCAIPGARGGDGAPALEQGKGTTRWLGPVDRLEVRWLDRATAADPRPTGSVDVLALWDATPAGDRLRTRLTCRTNGGASVLRLGLEPGMLVRTASWPGQADVSWEGTADRPEWVARFDPPLPDGATVALDVWRPRPIPDKGDPRPVPRVVPLGIERSTGIFGFRRPPDWGGQLLAGTGAEALGEEAFVRAWGNLPDEPLTLSGAVRLAALPGRAAIPAVSVGPRSRTWRVQPNATLTVEPGRVSVLVDAELTERDGPVDEVDLTLPAEFQLTRVTADGLTDWHRPSTGRLALRFDGPSSRSRRIRIQGWIPVGTEETAGASSIREIDVPWPRWGTDDEPVAATLTVAGSTPVQLVGASGVTVVSSEKQGDGSTLGSLSRVSYRVDRPDQLGRLRWEVEPPRVVVKVHGQLTITPDAAEWAAVVRYDVSGGPLSVINLRLPNEWARVARVRVSGVSHQQVSETLDDSTFWAIRPERPIWGSQRVVIQARLPFPVGGERVFPELSPLGRGAADVHLRIVNATRQALSVEGSTGLQPIATVPMDPELTASSLRGVSITGYHVTRPGWSLRIKKVSDSEGAIEGTAEPRVERAKVVCVLAPDGSALGLSRIDVAASGRPFLAVGLAGSLRPLWTAVNGVPVGPLRDAEGRWLIPLADEGPSRVLLAWRGGESRPEPSGARVLPFPSVGDESAPTVIDVFAPPGVTIVSRSARLVATRFDRSVLEEARWLADQTAASLDGLDRSSRRDGEDLVAALVRFRLLLRQADRAAGWDPVATPREHLAGQNAIALATRGLRDELDAALRDTGLENLDLSSRHFLGLSDEVSPSLLAPTPESTGAVTVRAVGLPHHFVAERAGPGAPAAVLLWARGADQSVNPWTWFDLAMSLVLAALIAAAMMAGVWTRPWAERAALAAALALAALGAGPSGLAAGLILALVGRVTRTPA